MAALGNRSVGRMWMQSLAVYFCLVCEEVAAVKQVISLLKTAFSAVSSDFSSRSQEMFPVKYYRALFEHSSYLVKRSLSARLSSFCCGVQELALPSSRCPENVVALGFAEANCLGGRVVFDKAENRLQHAALLIAALPIFLKTDEDSTS